MKILIFEDSAPLRRMLRSVLAPLTAEIFECGDGQGALAAYATHQPDWVLMDIKMGEVDGITATREITANYPEARVLILTAYDDDALREAARSAGACEYVVKENLFELNRKLTDFSKEGKSSCSTK